MQIYTFFHELETKSYTFFHELWSKSYTFFHELCAKSYTFFHELWIGSLRRDLIWLASFASCKVSDLALAQ